MTVDSVLIVVPTFNERDNLPLLVPAVLAEPGYRMIVVDDDSPDGTGRLADELATCHPGRLEVLHRTGPRGLGRSYVEGLTHAMRSPAEVICQMDADLSHDPRHLPDIVAATREHDLVVGSRYVPGGGIENWPRRRKMLSAAANRYIRTVTRLKARDCTSGYRAWRRDALARLPLAASRSDGYSFLVEMLCRAAALGLSIGERPITFVERRHGESKLSLPVLVESAITPWRFARVGRLATTTDR